MPTKPALPATEPLDQPRPDAEAADRARRWLARLLATELLDVTLPPPGQRTEAEAKAEQDG